MLGEVRAEVLHARQELRRLVGCIQPAALGGHYVDRIGLAAIAIGRGVLACGEPGLERGLHGRALDVGLLVAELMVVGEAEHLEAHQQDDQCAKDRHAKNAVVPREQARQHRRGDDDNHGENNIRAVEVERLDEIVEGWFSVPRRKG